MLPIFASLRPGGLRERSEIPVGCTVAPAIPVACDRVYAELIGPGSYPPSFFGALLDREKGGEFSIRPADAYRVERRYVEDTAICETRWLSLCFNGSAPLRLVSFAV